MNTKLVKTDWGFEIYRRAIDNDPKSSFKQVGAGVVMTISNHLGRELTPAEASMLASTGCVEVQS